MLPHEWGHVGKALPHRLGETILVTVHPEHVAHATLSLVDLVVLVGQSPEKRLGGEEPLVGRPGEEPGVARDSGIARELEPGQQ